MSTRAQLALWAYIAIVGAEWSLFMVGRYVASFLDTKETSAIVLED
jgi:hypothetical protein